MRGSSKSVDKIMGGWGWVGTDWGGGMGVLVSVLVKSPGEGGDRKYIKKNSIAIESAYSR